MTDYSGVLSDLRERRAALKQELAQLEDVIRTVETMAKDVAGATVRSQPKRRPYRGMTMVTAARKCLEVNGGGPMNAHQISAELLEGGFKTRSKKFNRMLYNVMFRSDDFHSESGMWSLTVGPTYIVDFGAKTDDGEAR